MTRRKPLPAASGEISDPNDAIIELAAACRFSPKRWTRLAWDWGMGELKGYDGPRPWQDEINELIGAHLADPATRYQPLQISVASGHGIGKSAEMGMNLSAIHPATRPTMMAVTQPISPSVILAILA